MVADWIHEEAWDVLKLGGKRIPGIARIQVRAPTGVDIQKASGKKKARVVDRGNEPAELTIEIEVEPSERGELQAAMNTLRPRNRSAAQKYLTIDHPAAAFWGINQVVIGDMGSPHPTPGGNFFLTFSAIEHDPQPAKVKKPKPATDDGSWSNDEVDKLTNALAPSKANAAEKNFTAPEDITNWSALDGTPWSMP